MTTTATNATKAAKAATKAAKDATKETESLVTNMADQAFKNWEKALRSGIKLQEDAAKRWSEAYTTASVAEDWQKRMIQISSFASGFVPQAQKQMEQAMDLMGKSARAASEICQKAMDAAQTPIMPEPDSKWMDLWTASTRATRATSEGLMEMNNQAVAAWLQFMRKSGATANAA